MQLAAQISAAMEQARKPSSHTLQQQQQQYQQQQHEQEEGQEELTDPVEGTDPTQHQMLDSQLPGPAGSARPRASMCDQPSRQAATHTLLACLVLHVLVLLADFYWQSPSVLQTQTNLRLLHGC